jgi:hypothetical protein
MSAARNIELALDQDIALTHERFLRAMAARMPGMNLETKERYFAVLSLLVAKLEAPDKNLREILEEMMVEAATHMMEELSSHR